MVEKINKSYKFRFYPTAEQKQKLKINFGHARYIFNHSLHASKTSYEAGNGYLDYNTLSKNLTALKQTEDHSWLQEASATVLVQKLRDLATSFKNFFSGRTKYPRFKKLSEKQSIRYQLDQRCLATTYLPGKLLKLPGLGELDIKWSRIPQGIPKMVTVSRVGDRYYVSLSCEEEIEPLPQTHKTVGIDLGVKHLAVTSDEEYFPAPKYTYRYARKLKLAQRVLSRTKLYGQQFCDALAARRVC